jgi:hypothetical protein
LTDVIETAHTLDPLQHWLRQAQFHLRSTLGQSFNTQQLQADCA